MVFIGDPIKDDRSVGAVTRHKNHQRYGRLGRLCPLEIYDEVRVRDQEREKNETIDISLREYTTSIRVDSSLRWLP
jgi:hypothetical protein